MKNKLFTILAITTVFALATQAQKKPDSLNDPLESQIDSVSYSLGLMVAKNLSMQGFKNINYNAFEQGFYQMLKDKDPKIKPEDANIIIQEYMSKLMSAEGEQNRNKGDEFLEKNKKKEGVITLSSGLQYEVIKQGEGPSPKSTDEVSVHYQGTLIDGTVFDSSIERGQPASFEVNKVISGWTEALKLMKPGAKWILYIPPELAYGERGASDVIGPNSTLIFEVELLEIME